MNFRIVELKEKHKKPLYKPQYLTFWFWRNISTSSFVNSGYMITQLPYGVGDCTDTMEDAQKVIDEFKIYLESLESYKRIHIIN